MFQKKIPNQFAVGYDIQSTELDEQKRLIEVKTTTSHTALQFYNFTLTPNEFSSAESFKDRYFVYRLMVSKKSHKLFIIQDPVGLYKADTGAVRLKLSDGADITFDKRAGEEKRLLVWGN